MKIRDEELKDKRINANRPFHKEFLAILSIVLVCCTSAILLFNHLMVANASPWLMVYYIGGNLLFIVIVVSLVTRYIMYIGFLKPIREIRKAARKVAGGDFTVRVHSQSKNNKKDELEVLIEDFNMMVEELATIEMLKADFIANVSHEIKTPIAIIQSYASAIQKKELSKEEKQDYINTILDSSKRLSELVTDVLKLNKIENQEIIQAKTYSLDEQLRCSVLALENKFDEKDIEFDVDLDDVTITTDESLMEIVWSNLLTNAIKFTKPKGIVKVKLKQDLKNIIVSVSDTGCGMKQEVCKHVFERFYQGDTSHSSIGNGLGLSLVKRVIDLVGGQVKIESEVGKGTKFTVILSK